MGLFASLALGAVGGFLSSRSKKKEAKRQQKERDRAFAEARAALDPNAIVGSARRFTSLFREDIASRAAPQARQSAARLLGRTGLADTGSGALISSAARTGPEAQALGLGTQAALGNAASRSNIGLARAGLPPIERPDVFQDVVKGIGTGAESFSLFRGLR